MYRIQNSLILYRYHTESNNVNSFEPWIHFGLRNFWILRISNSKGSLLNIDFIRAFDSRSKNQRLIIVCNSVKKSSATRWKKNRWNVRVEGEVNTKACEVALMRIRSTYIHNTNEDGVKRAGGTEPIVNFPKITCTRLQPNITDIHAPKEKLDTVVHKLFLANNSWLPLPYPMTHRIINAIIEYNGQRRSWDFDLTYERELYRIITPC